VFALNGVLGCPTVAWEYGVLGILLDGICMKTTLLFDVLDFFRPSSRLATLLQYGGEIAGILQYPPLSLIVPAHVEDNAVYGFASIVDATHA
jgi:hypothetical protein